jgi:hypothetical protein
VEVGGRYKTVIRDAPDLGKTTISPYFGFGDEIEVVHISPPISER